MRSDNTVQKMKVLCYEGISSGQESASALGFNLFHLPKISNKWVLIFVILLQQSIQMKYLISKYGSSTSSRFPD